MLFKTMTPVYKESVLFAGSVGRKTTSQKKQYMKVGIARIVKAIRDNQGAVLTLANLTSDMEGLEGVSLSG